MAWRSLRVVGEVPGILVAELLTREQVLGRECPIPTVSGVYGFWFDAMPPGVPTEGCEQRDGWVLTYVGISPGRPPRNGKPPSSQTVKSRVRYHFRGNAEGSTLRFSLGVVLAEQLGIELRRVGSGRRMTFAAGEAALSDWMHQHARVSIEPISEPWVLEAQLLSSLSLPLNLDGNDHPYRATLSAARSAAKQRARTLDIAAS